MSLIVTAYLLETYGTRLTLDQLGKELSMSPGSIRNQISEGRFPVPTYLDQGRRFADARDLAAYLDEMREKARAGRKGLPA